MVKITIIGNGAWGTALSVAFSRKYSVTLFGRNKKLVEDISKTSINKKYLPNIKLPNNINFSSGLLSAVESAEIIIFAIPAKEYSNICKLIKPKFKKQKILITAKGLMLENELFLFNIVRKYLSSADVSILSGPNFAEDVAKQYPVATVIASDNLESCTKIANLLLSKTFRTYPSSDMIGISLCGGLKNIYAIGAGILASLDFSPSTESFYITRTVAEIVRILRHFGGKDSSAFSVAGIGDLIMCCQNKKSRNMKFGYIVDHEVLVKPP